jgi:DNA-binding YbaB/EbfC family protein
MVNINQFLKQAQSMQKKMEEFKEKMAATEYVGKAGGNLVSLVLNGESQLKSISIDPSILKAEEKEMVEDLIVAAFNDAKNKVDSDSQNQLSSSLGGMGLPPGMKLPF